LTTIWSVGKKIAIAHSSIAKATRKNAATRNCLGDACRDRINCSVANLPITATPLHPNVKTRF
jgi:hypothetical protein